MAALFEEQGPRETALGVITHAEVASARPTMDDYSRCLERMATIYERLSRMVLDGEGLEAIVVTLGHLLSRPVLVQDRFFKELASAGEGSNELAVAEVFEDPRVADRVKRVMQEHHPALFPPFLEYGMKRSRVMAPIVVGREMVGYLSIFENERPLEDIEFTMAAHASTVLALEVMKERTAFEVENRLKGNFVEDLLSGTHAEEKAMLSRARHLGYNLSQPHYVLLVEPDETGVPQRRRSEHDAARLRHDIEEIVQGFIQKSAPGCIAAAKGGTVALLVPEAFTGPTPQAIHGLANNLHTRIVQVLPEVPISVGGGRLCRTVADYKESFTEARRSLDIMRRCGRQKQVVFFQTLGVYRLLSLIEDRGELNKLAEQALGPVLQYDRVHGTQWVRTLGNYLESGRNLDSTARSMFIHVNTLKYRLKRIQDIAGLDLNSAEERFNLHLAIKILHAIGPASA
ncbi:MAG TPA: helix-turn-helix domain-containing protein [Chloroflexota bacterium]|nr:helix-turn-helix domain-containing protein [Chloroflexota bacterium]